MQILETKEVKKYYQTPSGIVRALDGVSLSVTEGTFGAIVGSSGSGKTTLLQIKVQIYVLITIMVMFI